MQTAARLSPWWRGAAAAPRTTPSPRARHRASRATRAAPAPAWPASGGAPPRRRGRSPRAASSVFLQQLPAQPPQILLEDINHLLQPPPAQPSDADLDEEHHHDPRQGEDDGGRLPGLQDEGGQQQRGPQLRPGGRRSAEGRQCWSPGGAEWSVWGRSAPHACRSNIPAPAARPLLCRSAVRVRRGTSPPAGALSLASVFDGRAAHNGGRWNGVLPNVGFPELILLLAIALLVFGPQRLAGMGTALGRAIREFRRGLQEPDQDRPDSEPRA